MIKLIATDMDGTFLDTNKNFDIEFFKTYQKMKAKNIKFVVASGNQYHRLYQKFLPISQEFIFIAENGSFIASGTKPISINTITIENVKTICQLFENREDLFIILCGKDCAYILNKNINYKETIQLHYCSYMFVEDFSSIMGKDIMKIAVFSPDGTIVTAIDDIKDDLPNEVKVVTSGNMWMDIQNKNINKGIALKHIQEMYNITPDECMAFGDQMNDYELLQSVKYSYAMANAVDPIKDIAYAICLSNDKQGAYKIMKEYIDQL